MVAVVCTIATVSSAYANEIKELDVQWSVNVDQRLPNSPLAFSAPAIMKHGDETWLVLGGRDKWVHVYDISGAEVRRFRLGEASDSGALALENGLVALGDTAGRLYGVDPEQGKVVWQQQLTADFTCTPVAIEHDFLVQTTDHRIYRFSQNGEKQWSYAGQGGVLSMYLNAEPIVHGGYVYAVLGNGDVVALNADNGDLIWKRQLLLNNNSVVLSDIKAPLAAPLFLPSLHMGGEVSENVLLVSFFQGELIAISIADGAQRFSLPLSLKSTPLVLESILYAADSSGFLHAYNIEKGNRLWRKRISEHELLGPVLWQDSLWLADNYGVLYQLDKDGQTQATATFAGHISRLPIVTEAGIGIRDNRGAMHLVKQ